MEWTRREWEWNTATVLQHVTWCVRVNNIIEWEAIFMCDVRIRKQPNAPTNETGKKNCVCSQTPVTHTHDTQHIRAGEWLVSSGKRNSLNYFNNCNKSIYHLIIYGLFCAESTASRNQFLFVHSLMVDAVSAFPPKDRNWKWVYVCAPTRLSLLIFLRNNYSLSPCDDDNDEDGAKKVAKVVWAFVRHVDDSVDNDVETTPIALR